MSPKQNLKNSAKIFPGTMCSQDGRLATCKSAVSNYYEFMKRKTPSLRATGLKNFFFEINLLAEDSLCLSLELCSLYSRNV